MLTLDTHAGPIDWEPTQPAPRRDAADFCSYHEIELRPEGRALLRPGLGTQDYFTLLLEHGCYADARRVLAHALPKRRALWWGCLCAWDLYRPQPPAEVDRALQAVVRFLLQPDELNRRAVADCARGVEPTSVAHCLAMAAFCSDGSIAPPGLPCVEPRPFITGRLVGVAVYLVSVMRDPVAYKERLREYLAVGLDVARGVNLWPMQAGPVTVEEPAEVPVPEFSPIIVSSFAAGDVALHAAPADEDDLLAVT